MMYRPACDRRFRVLDLLGEGGTARVVRAFDTEQGREVAIKFQAPDSGISEDTFRGLIRREYELIGGFKAPQLVNVLDSPSPSYSHLLLELCHGRTAADIGRIEDLSTALNLIAAMALSLETVHALGIIHGDFKSQNVYLPAAPGPANAGLFWLKVGDFSLGRRAAQPDKDRLGRGTVGWMAPETLVDGTTSVQSDLFALGLVAYTLLTGEHPFLSGESEPVVISSRVREEPHQPLGKLRPDAPAVLVQLLDRLLAKVPELRPTSAHEVCRSLALAGASYDFGSALRPSHLLDQRKSFAENCAAVVSSTATQRAQLSDDTDERLDLLRLLLTANFVRGNLRYHDYHFRFEGDLYWPTRVRHFFLAKWHKTSVKDQRAEIIRAVSAAAVRSVDPVEGRSEINGLTLQLAQMIHPRTIQRVARRLLSSAAASITDTAPVLHLMTGRYEEAAAAASDLARQYHQQHQSQRALRMLGLTVRLCSQAGRAELTRPLLCACGDICRDTGALDDAATAYTSAVALSDELTPDDTLARAYKGLGETYRLQQDFGRSLEYLSKSLKALEGRQDELEISHVHNNLGNAYWMVSDMARARQHYIRALRIQKRLKAGFEIASTTHNLASLYCLDGRLRRGVFLLERALSLKKELGHKGEIARTLNNLSYAYSMLGQTGQAADAVMESLAINREIGSQQELLFNLDNATYLLTRAARLQEASQHLHEGLTLANELNDVGHQAVFLCHRSRIEIHRGRLGEAARRLAEAQLLSEDVDDRTLPPVIELTRARLREALGDRDGAIDAARLALARAVEARDVPHQVECLQQLARWTDDPEAVARAEALVREPHSEHEQHVLRFSRLAFQLEHPASWSALTADTDWLNYPLPAQDNIELPWMAVTAAWAYLHQGDPASAARLLGRVERLCRTSGIVLDLIVILLRQGQLAVRVQEYQEGYARLREALSLARSVADSLIDENDRVMFGRSALMRELTLEIRALTARLGARPVTAPGEAASLS